MEFEGQIYDVDLQADDQEAMRPRAISKRHYEPVDDFGLESDDGSEEMLADDTNAVGNLNSLKVTHKYVFVCTVHGQDQEVVCLSDDEKKWSAYSP